MLTMISMCHIYLHLMKIQRYTIGSMKMWDPWGATGKVELPVGSTSQVLRRSSAWEQKKHQQIRLCSSEFGRRRRRGTLTMRQTWGWECGQILRCTDTDPPLTNFSPLPFLCHYKVTWKDDDEDEDADAGDEDTESPQFRVTGRGVCCATWHPKKVSHQVRNCALNFYGVLSFHGAGDAFPAGKLGVCHCQSQKRISASTLAHGMSGLEPLSLEAWRINKPPVYQHLVQE